MTRITVLVAAGAWATTAFAAEPPAQTTSAQSAAAPAPGSKPASGPHFTRARELYDLGPGKAAEILAELDLELAENPENLRALSLKANTQIGTDDIDGALKTLDRYDEVSKKKTEIDPNGIYLRARCLYYKGDLEGAKTRLRPFRAFYEDDPRMLKKYDVLMADIEAALRTRGLPKDDGRGGAANGGQQ